MAFTLTGVTGFAAGLARGGKLRRSPDPLPDDAAAVPLDAAA